MNQETKKLLQELLEVQTQAIETASALTNEQLDTRVPGYGGREMPVRNILYQMAAHPREHAVHITKILQETEAPNAQPTEAQMIMGLVWHSLGELMATCARLEGSDLGRELEEQTIGGVLEHVRDGYNRWVARLEDISSS